MPSAPANPRRGGVRARCLAALVLLSASGPAPAAPIEGLKVGGALRLNYSYREWSPAYNHGGQVDLDTARINLDYERGPWIGSAEYRYYDFRAGPMTHFIHHGWIGYRFDERRHVEAGVTKVPFGVLPFASHNWFFQLPYYVGLEDDYDLGIKYVERRGPWDWRFAYYVTDEGNGRGDSNDSARYSYDLVKDSGAQNEQRNQLNARGAYAIAHGPGDRTEVGLSLQYGQVRNLATGRDGANYAAAVHVDGRYGRWGVKAEIARYVYDLENSPAEDDRIVVMGAYDFPYNVAARGNLAVLGVSYRLPVDWGPIKTLTFYNDYSVLTKDAAGFADSEQNVAGVSLAGGPWLVYVDFGFGRNHPFLSPAFTDGLAAGGPGGWHERFNLNVGYYF